MFQSRVEFLRFFVAFRSAKKWSVAFRSARDLKIASFAERKATLADLGQQPAPTQLQSDGHVLAKVLHAADGVQNLVLLVETLEMRVIEFRLPGDGPIGHEIDHVGPGQRSRGINENGVALQERAEILPASTGPKKPPLG